MMLRCSNRLLLVLLLTSIVLIITWLNSWRPEILDHLDGILKPNVPAQDLEFHQSPTTPISTNESLPTESSQWYFNSTRHAQSHALSAEQCDLAFPDYYSEIERAKKYWLDRGGVHQEDIDIKWQTSSGMLRLLIYDQQLYVIDKHWDTPAEDITRGLALLHQINRAIITSPEPLPNVDFSLNLGDWPRDYVGTHPVWVLARAKDDPTKWVMPDFGYWSWALKVVGGYTEVRQSIRQSEPEWRQKIKKAVWRGSTNTNTLRDRLMDASAGKKWSDIKAVGWSSDGTPVINSDSDFILSIPEHCNYRFVVHTEGNTYSGRGKYLLNCHSVSIIHDQDWIEPHSHLYKDIGPEQNMVLVDREFSTLADVMEMLLRDDKKAQRIAVNSVETFRDQYLTPAAQTCYWRKMMRAWAEVSHFEPKLYVDDDMRHQVGDGKIRELRGTAYETFVTDVSRLEDTP